MTKAWLALTVGGGVVGFMFGFAVGTDRGLDPVTALFMVVGWIVLVVTAVVYSDDLR